MLTTSQIAILTALCLKLDPKFEADKQVEVSWTPKFGYIIRVHDFRDSAWCGYDDFIPSMLSGKGSTIETAFRELELDADREIGPFQDDMMTSDGVDVDVHADATPEVSPVRWLASGDACRKAAKRRKVRIERQTVRRQLREVRIAA